MGDLRLDLRGYHSFLYKRLSFSNTFPSVCADLVLTFSINLILHTMRFLQVTVTVATIWASVTLALPSQRNIYAGTKVFRIPTGNQNQTAKISNLIDTLGLPAWTTARISYSHIDVQVSKKNLAGFHNALKGVDPALDSQLVTMHEDLGESILKEAEGMNTPHVDAFGSFWYPSQPLQKLIWYSGFSWFGQRCMVQRLPYVCRSSYFFVGSCRYIPEQC